MKENFEKFHIWIQRYLSVKNSYLIWAAAFTLWLVGSICNGDFMGQVVRMADLNDNPNVKSHDSLIHTFFVIKIIVDGLLLGIPTWLTVLFLKKRNWARWVLVTLYTFLFIDLALIADAIIKV